jgi:formylmethanofuran dehydrogenase subunit C
MSPLVFTLKHPPDQRIDCSRLTAGKLVGLSRNEIVSIEINTTRRKLTVGDLFRIGGRDPESIRILGATERFDNVGAAMDGGEILVEGDVGSMAGRLMAGGRLTIQGSAGPWAGSGMRGGRLTIAGDAADWLGGPLPGEMAGMRGGILHVAGSAGTMAGDRLRRGVIFIGGGAGPYAGSRMIAGTLIVSGAAGPLPGYLMRRGTILLARKPQSLSPTFVPTGTADLVFRRLLAASLAQEGIRAAWLGRPAVRRFMGDTAALGKGELIVAG